MKHLIVFFLWMLCITQTFAQYEVGDIWKIIQWQQGIIHYGNPYLFSVLDNSISDVDMFCGKEYFVVKRNRHHYGEVIHTDTFLIRSDSGLVYWKGLNWGCDSTDLLLYDFNVEKGDTVLIPYINWNSEQNNYYYNHLLVNEISSDSSMFFLSNLSTYLFNNNSYFSNGDSLVWFKNMGASSWGLFYSYHDYDSRYTYALSCKNGQVLDTMNMTSCGVPVFARESEPTSIKVLTSPEEYFLIDNGHLLALKPIDRLEFYTPSGKRIGLWRKLKKDSKLSLVDIRDGLIIVKITTAHQEFVQKKYFQER